MWCWICIGVGLITCCCGCADFCGCFDACTDEDGNCEFHNSCIDIQASNGAAKIIEIIFWGVIVYMTFIVIEQTASESYISYNLDNNAYAYLENNCNVEAVAPDDVPSLNLIWTEFDFDVPGWLQTDAYNYLGFAGIGLAILEFACWFWVNCICRKYYKGGKNGIEMTMSIS